MLLFFPQGSYPSYPPQPTHPPAFSASQPSYAPAMGAVNYAATGGGTGLYPSVAPSYPPASSYPAAASYPTASPMAGGMAHSYPAAQSAYPTSSALPSNAHLSQVGLWSSCLFI